MTIIDFETEKEKRAEKAEALLYQHHCEKFGTYEDWDGMEVQYLLWQLRDFYNEVDGEDSMVSWMALMMIIDNYECADNKSAVVRNIIGYIKSVVDYYIARSDLDKNHDDLMLKIKELISASNCLGTNSAIKTSASMRSVTAESSPAH